MQNNQIKQILSEHGLKVTFQRYAVLQILTDTDSHPSADYILNELRKTHPTISTGAVYHILDVFVNKGIINRVVTENNTMRYDALTKKHHHVYLADNDEIVDYFDEDLTELIRNYLNKREIADFEIEDFNLQLIARKKA